MKESIEILPQEPIEFLPIEDMIFESVVSIMSESMDWGLISTGIPEAHKHSKGKGITVAVLDTGIPNHIDLIDNLIEGKNASDMPDGNDKQGHGCVAPDDMVYTSLCGLQEIQTLFERAPGITFLNTDKSIIKNTSRYNLNTLSFNPETHETEAKRVLAIHKLPYNGEIYKVKTREGELSLTPWHPVYICTSRRCDDWSIIKKRADELNIGDKIICSSETNEEIGEYIKLPFKTEWICKFCGHKATGGKRKQCRKCNKTHWNDGQFTTYITLDENMAFWVGLVASDGHVMKSQSAIEFCGNNQNLINIFDDLCFKLFGKHASENYKDTRNSLKRVRLHDVNSYNLIQNIGINSGKKSLTLDFPELIAKSPKSVIFSFLAGYIEGDGNVSKEGRLRIITGSKQFAEKTVVLLRTLGVRSSLSINKSGFSNKNNENANVCYVVRIAYCNELKSLLKIKTVFDKRINLIENKRNMTSITNINVEQYNGDMYDFTVEDNHNYVANGMFVSNTHVGGIIAACENGMGIIGVAPEAKVMPIKVLNDNGSSQYFNIANGLRMAIDAKVDIINMSLGSPANPGQAFYSLIQEAYEKGIIIVAAAGNDSGAVNFPAKYHEVIAVAAIDQKGNLARFSSRGEQVTASAPGVNVYSTFLNNQYAILNGTSQASPFMAGVCALILSWSRNTPDVTPIRNAQDMLFILDELCDPSGQIVKGKVGNIGFGIPQFANFMPWRTVAPSSLTDDSIINTTAATVTGEWVNAPLPPLEEDVDDSQEAVDISLQSVDVDE
jgi:subtilisin family serine protease